MKKNLLAAFMLAVAGNTFAKTPADTLVVTTQHTGSDHPTTDALSEL